MPITKPPEEFRDEDIRINFFKPRRGFMRKEVTIIWFTLAAWAIVSIGFPIYLAITQTDPATFRADGFTVFGIPGHYWVSGQFLILWFIFICFIFNSLIDWLTSSYRKHR